MIDEIKLDADMRMEKAIEHLQEELMPIRSGRAHPGLVENIRVDYYGTPTPLKQLATINAPDARLLSVQPFDPGAMASIEKAINDFGGGLQASRAAENLIRIPIPELSQERRAEYVKMAKKFAEETRVAIRNVRRDANDALKKAEKGGDLTEDDLHGALDVIQKDTDKYIAEVDKLLAAKEKDLMKV